MGNFLLRKYNAAQLPLTLRLIKRHEPESIAELAELTGHKQKTLTKRLDTLSRYGFVALFQEKDTITPVSTLDWIKIAVL
ncbi:MAG: hypothetical protein GJU73_01395 [Ferrovum sp.]|jgi:predicted transcriptional regulator|uniref:HVO_A0114 family putative DNA-binding protein n=1 Tax=Ferrovum sp. TaxID=2609467 RepID=UPI00262CAA44|nr:hypothetical protein [Ferrovum sp.]MBW8066073.1 hypothetical protein [Ferrovum sp.]